MSRQQREALDTLLRDGPLDLGGDLVQQRPLLDQLMTAHPLPDDVTAIHATLGGVPVVTIAVRHGDSGNVIFYLHGGAYALGSAAAAAGLASDIARGAGAHAVSVDYRLAPEAPHPAALDDALAAYRGLLETGVPPAGIAVAGESAGAGLAVAMLVAAKSVGLPQPSCAVLLSPWADLTLTGASLRTKADSDPALTAEGLARRAADYVGGSDPASGLISPIFADLTGLPPLLIQVGSHEILLDDAIRLGARAAGADVAVTLQVTPDVPHVFQGFAAVLDEGRCALKQVSDFLRAHLGLIH
jgi:epsilon-lactone hydrolase